jgi:hypothetical protein
MWMGWAQLDSPSPANRQTSSLSTVEAFVLGKNILSICIHAQCSYKLQAYSQGEHATHINNLTSPLMALKSLFLASFINWNKTISLVVKKAPNH